MNADQTKTRQRRLVPRSASLEQWLEPYRQFTGKLWSSSDNVYCHALDDLKKLADISGRNILRQEPEALATEDPDRTGRRQNLTPILRAEVPTPDNDGRAAKHHVTGGCDHLSSQDIESTADGGVREVRGLSIEQLHLGQRIQVVGHDGDRPGLHRAKDV